MASSSITFEFRMLSHLNCVIIFGDNFSGFVITYSVEHVILFCFVLFSFVLLLFYGCRFRSIHLITFTYTFVFKYRMFVYVFIVIMCSFYFRYSSISIHSIVLKMKKKIKTNIIW